MHRFASAVFIVLQWTCVRAQTSTAIDQTATTACPQPGGVHIIVSRGSFEAPPYGGLGTVKDAILAQISGSTADGTVGYPNTLEDYFNSATAGAIIARGLIEDYVRRCPGLPLALIGGSQGANVLADALVGQNERGFVTNASLQAPLPASTLSQVAAVILAGDPTFNLTESFHVGTATKDGLFPRQNVANFDIAGLGSRTQSYCDTDDVICASGTSAVVHGSYGKTYGTVAVSYVVAQVKAWYAAHGSVGSASILIGTSTAASSAAATRPVASLTASTAASRTTSTMAAASTSTPASGQSTGAASRNEIAGRAAVAAFIGLVAVV